MLREQVPPNTVELTLGSCRKALGCADPPHEGCEQEKAKAPQHPGRVREASRVRGRALCHDDLHRSFSGLRVSELVGLKWDDVRDDGITVDERYCRGDWSVTKTVGSAITIGVAPSVISRIRRLKTLEVEINWGGKGAKKRNGT